jgi:integrase
VEAFLSDLAVRQNVAANTQNLALSAILFLYRDVLEIELPWLDGITRAKRPQRLPVVLSRGEAARLMEELSVHPPGLVARLLYGTGMRLTEGLRLRVKDVDLVRREIVVRDGKGAKDRVTMLPATMVEPLRSQLAVRLNAPALPSPSLRTCFGTPSPRTCSKAATTFAPCRSYWATAT